MLLLSIIIPVYNGQKTIIRLLKSIQKQNICFEYEIIIIDDGSNDNTVKLVNEYIKKENVKNLKIFSQANLGVSQARNIGIDKAIGKYVMFADADDYYNENAISEMFKYVSKDSFVMTAMKIRKENKEEIKKFSNNDVDILEKKNLYDIYIRDMLNSPCGRIYDSEIVKNNSIRFQVNVCKGEDLRFNIDYFKVFEGKIIFLNKPLYIYDVDLEGSNLKYTSNELELAIENYEYLLYNFNKYFEMDDNKNAFLYRKYFKIVIDRLWRYYKNIGVKKKIDDINVMDILEKSDIDKKNKKIVSIMIKLNWIFLLKVYCKFIL